jgi:hypothetical protein
MSRALAKLGPAPSTRRSNAPLYSECRHWPLAYFSPAVRSHQPHRTRGPTYRAAYRVRDPHLRAARLSVMRRNSRPGEHR